MKTLFKNGTVINVFTGECEQTNVLMCDETILGIGDYADSEADIVCDVARKYLCPGFIDCHIHIESSMLTPPQFARAAVLHGTSAVVADPHEIANVCGQKGIEYMLEAGKDLPLSVYITLPSCVPATPFDETGAVLNAEELKSFYTHPRVLGLGEMMNYPGLLMEDSEIIKKLQDAKNAGKTINGHAPGLSGKDLNRYIAHGIYDDHECSSEEEAKERIRRGQHIFVRQGTAAKNLAALLPLFDAPWSAHASLVTDDKHPKDLLENGHIDDIIRQAIALGKNPIVAIQMATIHAARHFKLDSIGAIAPGYKANLILLDDLNAVSISDVYFEGKQIVKNKTLVEFSFPTVSEELQNAVRSSFVMPILQTKDFIFSESGTKNCRVIGLVDDNLITKQNILPIDFSQNNGIDIARDIVKLAVCERHKGTGHKGVAFVCGANLKEGAIASSVSHDSHNLIILGANEADMACAGNRIREMGGGCVVVKNGQILAEMPLPVAGLMTDLSAEEAAKQNELVRNAVHLLGVPADKELFMVTAFVSLSVIPDIKLTTLGLVDVVEQKLVSLIAD